RALGAAVGPAAAAAPSAAAVPAAAAPAAAAPAALSAPRAVVLPPSTPQITTPPAPAPAELAAPGTGLCPEGTARLSRPATRDTQAATYCLDRHEVTAASYAQCVGAEGCAASRRAVSAAEIALPEVALPPAARRRAQAAFGAQCNSGAPGRGQHPMNCVTFDEAASYCKWRGGRLPSEAEWEFAAEGVNGRAFPWGSLRPNPTLVNAC